MIELGVVAKDVVTGFEGVVMGRAQYLTGCDQYMVKPQGLDKDGKVRDSVWFDENRLEVTNHESLVLPGDTERDPGGPTHDTPPPG